MQHAAVRKGRGILPCGFLPAVRSLFPARRVPLPVWQL